jgi:hypothetical protein
MRRAAVVIAALTAVGVVVSCTLTESFDGISGTRPADAGIEGGPAIPPGRPPGDPAPATPSRTLWVGVKHFHFAHSNDALKTPNAWQDWGWDIDGLCTGRSASEQTGTCRKSSGVSPEQVRDGNGCRDNNFGSQIVSQLNIYKNTFENDTNNGLLEGNAAWIFVLEDLGDGTDDPYVPGKLYLAAPTAVKMRPAWDGTDVRQLLPRSVDGAISKPKVTFPRGYLRNNVWVSGEAQSFEIALPIGATGELMPMPVRSGVIGFTLNASHTTVVDGTGQVAGAIALSDVEAFLKPFLMTQTPFCPGTGGYQNLLQTITTYADVVVAAPKLQDSSKDCDGISFGIGINLAPVAPAVTLGAEMTPSLGACGTDAGVPAADGAVSD